jgi:hypothetical protein
VVPDAMDKVKPRHDQISGLIRTGGHGAGCAAGQTPFFGIRTFFAQTQFQRRYPMAHKKIERKKEIDRRRQRREQRLKQRIREAKAAAKA